MSGPILDAIFFRQIKHANGVGKAPWSSICRPFLAFLDQIHLGKCPKGGRGRTELYNYDYLVFIVSATLYSSKPFGYPRVNLAK